MDAAAITQSRPIRAEAVWCGRIAGKYANSTLCVLIAFLSPEDDVNENGQTLFPRQQANRVTMPMFEEQNIFVPELERLCVLSQRIVEFNNAENIRRGEEGEFPTPGLMLRFTGETTTDFIHQKIDYILRIIASHMEEEWQLVRPIDVSVNNHACLSYDFGDVRRNIRYWLYGCSIASFYWGSPADLNDLGMYSIYHYQESFETHLDFIRTCWGEGRNCTWQDFKNWAVPIEYLRPEFSDYERAVSDVQTWPGTTFRDVIACAEAVVCFVKNDGLRHAEACNIVWERFSAVSDDSD